MEKTITHYPADQLLRQVNEAIDAGNLEEAKKNAGIMFNCAKGYHDGVLDMFSLALNYIADLEGEEGIGKVWRYIGDRMRAGNWRGFQSGKLTLDQYKEKIRMGEMGHYSDFTVEEDDEKLVCKMHDCGVCGRMCKQGKLDTSDKPAPFKLGTIKEPHDWTLGYTGMPYYCIHAPYLFSILPKENDYDAFDWIWGRQMDADGNLVDEPCHEIIYKHPKRAGDK